jgi:hypothetical protein
MPDYNDLISAVIKKFMTVVKKETIIKVANGVDGLQVDDYGNIVNLSRDGEAVFADLYQRLKEIGGGVAKIFAKQAVGPIIAADPGLSVPDELR